MPSDLARRPQQDFDRLREIREGEFIGLAFELLADVRQISYETGIAFGYLLTAGQTSGIRHIASRSRTSVVARFVCPLCT
jgi:hypothetical protein